MRMRVKAVLITVLFAVLLTGCSALRKLDFTDAEQDTKSRLVTASVLSEEELYARAKEELKHSEMHVYSSTTITEDVVENFMKEYPDLAGKVVYNDMDDESEYPRLVKEIENGAGGIDLLISHSDLVNELTASGNAYNYFPQVYEDEIDSAYRMPTAFMYSSTLFMYNASNGPVELTNVWALTEPEWAGKIIMKNPKAEQVNMNFFSMLTSPQWIERLKTAYLNYYGKAWTSKVYDNIAHEWINGFIKNCEFSDGSNSEIMRELVSTDETKIALVGFSKLRKLTVEERANIGIFALEDAIDGFGGFAFGTYATVIHNSECPYACALFINYILSFQGFAGENAWNHYYGYYSTNKTVGKRVDINDCSFTFWEDILVIEDPNYINSQSESAVTFIDERVESAVNAGH